MLDSLHIENIAVIERADVDFREGLNILTGETGAGKSILIDAINAVLGERVRRDLVRTGCEQAAVYATFSDISASAREKLAAAGYELEEDTLLIQRIIRADGKSSCRIGGRPATVSLLREIGRILVNIHGQHENQSLLDPARHLTYLERLGDLSDVRGQYEAAYHRYCDISRALKKITLEESEKLQLIDRLQYQIEELEAANLTAGEEKQWEAKRQFYRHHEKIAGFLQKAHGLLSGEDNGGAVSAVSSAAEALRHAGALVDEFSPLSERLDAVMYDLEELSIELSDYVESMDFDENDRMETENRLDLLHRLSKKYNADSEGLLRLLDQARADLQSIESADQKADDLRAQLEIQRNETVAAAERLTAARQAVACQFEKRVGEELSFLDMPYVQLKVSIEPTPLTVIGGDKVEFLLSVNPGEPAKPLAQIASGGELSRMMLAIKSVMAEVDDIDTLIFDEIDTGISGHAAVKVGVKLRQIAAHRQTLCVTHLAQIAARAHHHLLIHKTVKDGRTYTDVRSLSTDQRERELARIIGGDMTAATLEAAREMRLAGERDN